MRTKNSILNVSIGMGSQILITIAGVIARRVFFDVLGEDMQGINATLSSIISMLSLTDLGIGTAVICNLYKPLANDDRPTVISLMQLYSKLYRIIAAVIFGLGLCITPFLDQIVGKSISKGYLSELFMLFLIETVVSYLFAYKRSIITADQKNYVVTVVTTISSILLQVSQIIILILTHDFVLFLVVRILSRLAENLIIAYIANKKYPYIVTKQKYPINSEIKGNIITNTKALALHYAGNYITSNTDVPILSMFFSVAISGFYSNYLMITSTLRNILGQFSNGLIASFGNMIACDDNEASYSIFKKTWFINFVLYNYATATLLCLFNPVISIWIDPSAVLDNPVVLLIVINFYLVGISETIGAVRSSAGIFRPDSYLHVFLAVLKLVVSIALVQVKSIGIMGVFIGTLLCLIVKEVIVLPAIIYNGLFYQNVFEYYFQLLKYIAVTAISTVPTYMLCTVLPVHNAILSILIKLIICCIIPNVIVVLFFFRTEEFQYAKQLFFKVFRKILHRGGEEL